MTVDYRIEAKLGTTDDQFFDEELTDFDSVTPTWDNAADVIADFDSLAPSWDCEVHSVSDFDSETDPDSDLNDSGDYVVATFDDANPAYGKIALAAANQTSWFTRFIFNHNNVSIEDTKAIIIAKWDGSAAVDTQYLYLHKDGGVYSIRPAYRSDGNAFIWACDAITLDSGDHEIWVQWVASTGPGNNDGIMKVWIDGVYQNGTTTADTDTVLSDWIEVGIVLTTSTTFGGSIKFKDLYHDVTGGLYDYDGYIIAPFVDATARYGTLNLGAVNQASAVAKFNLDPNSLSLEDTKYINLFHLYNGASQTQLIFRLYNTAGQFQLLLYVRNDADGFDGGTKYDIADDEVEYTIFWAASTGAGNDDGVARIYADGVLLCEVTGIDNDTKDADYGRLGMLVTNSTTFGGSIKFKGVEIDPFGGPMLSTLAAQDGIYGMAIPVMDNTSRHGKFTDPDDETVVMVEFDFAPNNIAMANNNQFIICRTSDYDFLLQLTYTTTDGYGIQAGYKNDAGVTQYGTPVLISDACHAVRLIWGASSGAGNNDGFYQLYIDKALAENVTGIDNDTRSVSSIEFGAIAGIDAGTYGIIYFDNCRWGPWIDITNKVIENIDGYWGLADEKPTTLMADTGEMSLLLNNEDGQFVPGVTGAIPGWDKGTHIRLVFYNDFERYTRFRGVISELDPDAGLFGGDKVGVVVVDWLDYAATHPLLSPAIASDKRSDEMATTIVADMPIAPLNTDFEEGVTTFDTAFDTLKEKTTAYSELSKITLSEFGPCYLRKDPVYGETLVLENEHTRNGLRTADFTLDNSMKDIELVYGENVVNRAVLEVFPRYIDANISVLWELGSPIVINAGETITIEGYYTDPEGGAPAVGANMINPEMTTDYLMNDDKDGGGADRSANLIVTPSFYPAYASLELTNGYTGPCWITMCQVRGYRVYKYNKLVRSLGDSDSADEYGYKELRIKQKYQQDLFQGTQKIAYILDWERKPRLVPKSVTFIANRSADLMDAWLNGDVGKVVRVKKDDYDIDVLCYISMFCVIFKMSSSKYYQED